MKLSLLVGSPPSSGPLAVQADTHEVALLDSTGVVCASLMTAGDAMASREGRIKEAERNREFGILTYKYRVTAPGDFGGYPCGVFVKWSTVNEYRGFQPGSEGQVPSFGEAGLMLYGWDEFLLPGLYFGGGTRPSVGFYSEASVPGSDDIFLRLPINLGFMISPYWAGGLALRATAGADIMSMLLMAKSQPFRNGFWVPLDYDVRSGPVAGADQPRHRLRRDLQRQERQRRREEDVIRSVSGKVLASGRPRITRLGPAHELERPTAANVRDDREPDRQHVDAVRARRPREDRSAPFPEGLLVGISEV